MGRPKKIEEVRRSRTRYLVYAIPLMALIGVAVVYSLSVLPVPASSAAVNFTFQMEIDMTNKNGTQVRAIAPANSIGEAGGFWNSSQYSANGVDSTHYPIYMDSPATACTPVCLIHVKSKIVHSYTLGDFFNVWGYPLGPTNTIGQPSQGTFAWEMCLGPPTGSAVSSNEWGGLVLQSGMYIRLWYYDTANGLGCAAS